MNLRELEEFKEGKWVLYISEGGNRLKQSSNGHDGDDEGMKSIKNMKKRKKERENEFMKISNSSLEK